MLKIVGPSLNRQNELQSHDNSLVLGTEQGLAYACPRSSLMDAAKWLVASLRKKSIPTSDATAPSPSSSSSSPMLTSTMTREPDVLQNKKLDLEESYAYQPLDTTLDEIRVLEVHAGTYSDILRCSVHHCSLLDSQTKYETISYCWGRSFKRRSMELNGRHFFAPILAYRALKRMRLGSSSRFLWIDAVCINQCDLEERSQQVAMMSKVYSRSQGNLIYLGEHDTCSAAFVSIHGVLENAAAETEAFVHLESRVLDDSGAWKVSVPFSPVVLKDKTAWDVFWGVGWFRRLWVSQEAILAPSNHCFYGEQSINLLDVVRAAVWHLHKNRFLPTTPAIRQALLNMAFMWHSMDKQFSTRARERYGKGDSVAYALTCARSFESIEPRDHVYGRLGLMQCASQRMPEPLRPDYRKSVESVFRDATWFSIREEGVDMVFPDVRHRSNDDLENPHWRSWVPHWDVAWNEHEDATELPWSEGSAIEPEVFQVQDGTLSIKGLLIDHVVEHTNQCLQPSWFSRSNEENADLILDWLEAALSILATAKKISQPGNALPQSHKELLGHTLIARAIPEVHDNHERISSGVEQYWSFLLRNRRVPDVLYPPDFSCTENGMSPSWKYQWTMRQHSQNRRFFATAKGLVGIGPKILQNGDVVVTFAGAWKFYLLRSFGSRYRLVGESHVHGLTPADVSSAEDQFTSLELM